MSESLREVTLIEVVGGAYSAISQFLDKFFFMIRGGQSFTSLSRTDWLPMGGIPASASISTALREDLVSSRGWLNWVLIQSG